MEKRNLSDSGAAPEKKTGERRLSAARSSFGALYRKELSDHLSGFRFYLIFGILLVVSIASMT